MFDDPGDGTAFLYGLARESDVTGLVAHLKRSDSPLVRRRAAEILGDLSNDPTHDAEQEAVRALVGAVFEDDDDSVRAQAIDALVRYGRDGLDHLVDELTGPEAGDGTGAGDAPDWVTARVLEEWLDAEQPAFRMTAAVALGRIGGGDALSALLDAVTDPNPRVRTRAVRSCGQIGDGRCVPAVRERLDDPDRSVRRAAIRALGSIGTRQALEPLVPVARVDEEPLRRAAIEELCQFGSLEPVVVLLRAIADDTESVQRAATFSLIRLFVDAGGRDRHVRKTVAEQLRDTEARTVLPHLVEILAESQRAPVQRTAAWLLGRVADPDPSGDYLDAVYDGLLDALDDPDETTAEFAAASLAELGSEELERRLHVFIETGTETEAATTRAETVLEAVGGDPADELVTNAVDYTYVREPVDYTEKRRQEDGSRSGGGDGNGNGNGNGSADSPEA
jgi:HEAT repeat protein